MTENSTTSKYRPLLISAGLGSVLGSGIIVGLSSTITIWQNVLHLDSSQVGIISSLLTLSIAAGSLLAGKITKTFGLIKSYNWIDLFFALGSVLILSAQNFWMLIVGVIIAGFFSGADLPISLTMISHDAPDDKISAQLVSGTQIYWTIGIILATLIAFVTSAMRGASSARIEMGVLTVIALVTFFYRTKNAAIASFHLEAEQRKKAQEKTMEEQKEKVSVMSLLFSKHSVNYLAFFICILIFYCSWNLLANTFGQFQTYMLVKANASQTFATGAGLVLNLVCLVVAAVFSKMAGGKNRNVAFAAGIVIMIAALCGLALTGTNLIMIVSWIALQNVGSTFAGEAMYKVWTQESFPPEYRSGIQGFINGFSRLCCAAFALITPVLVLPEHIRTTMIGFAVLIAAGGIFGLIQIRLQKKYHIGSND